MQDAAAEFPHPFGPYTLKRKIASGGMAELFLGETHGPGGFSKPVVVKMIRKDLGADPRFVAMFTEEAKTLAGFVHGNIVPIFDFGQIDGRPYLVMEFIDGVDAETLTETCRVEGIALSPDVAVWLGIGAASALHYAHTASDPSGRPLRLVHRDVSPHNILVSRAGEIKLCDFGIAFSAAQESGDDADIIKGKLHFMSPEQASGEPVDRRSDLFSLGVTLFEIVAGRHPSGSGSRLDILRILSERKGYPKIGEFAPWLDESFARIIDKSMEFDVAARYQTAEEVRQDLTQLLHESYRTFSPSRVGDLVTEIQERLVIQDSASHGGTARAQLASFASEVRSASFLAQLKGKGAKRRSRLKREVALGAAAAAVVAAAIFAIAHYWGSDDARPGHALPGEADASPKRAVPPPIPPPATNAADTGEKAAPDAGTQPPKADTEDPHATAEKPRGFGFLVANASPWAELRVDGKRVGDTPIKEPLKLAAGKHHAVFTNPELGKTVQRTFSVRPGQTVQLIVDMEE
jgi:eukaryotic-like serine/threonine-protein kinase